MFQQSNTNKLQFQLLKNNNSLKNSSEQARFIELQ